MAFLDQSYELPTSGGGNYMKFEQGQNKFRVLSNAITGYEYWTTDNKPVRSPEKIVGIPENAKMNVDPEGSEYFAPRHFWAMVVYNYSTKQVEILQITQKNIQTAMLDYYRNDAYGDPKNYDIVVARKGEKYETKYTVMANPPKEVDPKIMADYAGMAINLDALYDGGNPFDASEKISEELIEEIF